MRVKNLVPWAGDDFSVLPGEEIDLDDDVALARIEAGLVEAIADDKPAKGKAKKAKAETPPADPEPPADPDPSA